MVTSISNSPEATQVLGELWGRDAKPGWVIAVSGDLGAGKTQLVKGIARGLGIQERVHSPTFNLVNVYSGGRIPLFHLDLYRLESPEQIFAAGLEEYLNPAGVAVIEWAERWFDAIPKENAAGSGNSADSPQGSKLLRRVWIESLSEKERRISYEDIGG